MSVETEWGTILSPDEAEELFMQDILRYGERRYLANHRTVRSGCILSRRGLVLCGEGCGSLHCFKFI